MWYGYLADLVVAVHVAYMGYVILGQLAILLGLVLKWGWVRNPWFRITHLLAIVIVAVEAIFGIACPLTVWESNLRVWAGQEVSEGTFIGRFMHYLLFHPLPTWVYTSCYLTFAFLVLLTFLLAPPRLRWPERHHGPAVTA